MQKVVVLYLIHYGLGICNMTIDIMWSEKHVHCLIFSSIIYIVTQITPFVAVFFIWSLSIFHLDNIVKLLSQPDLHNALHMHEEVCHLGKLCTANPLGQTTLDLSLSLPDLHRTTHGSILWNNKTITIKWKTLFKQEWYEKIHFIQFNSFIEKFN